MPYHHRVILTLIFPLLFSLGAIGQSSNSSNNPPNIICILVDDLGYGDLANQGAEDMKTPHLDKFAREGLVLTNFYANSTVCSPSRAALLTGRYPDLVGVPGVIRQNEENNWGYLAPEAILLPQVLKSRGYHTAIIGKWHLGLEAPNRPTDRGFDLFRGFLGDMMDDYWNHRRGGINWMRHNEEEIDPEGHATDIFTDWAVEYLQRPERKKQPFFLYLAYNAPHFPIQPPQEWLEKVLDREAGIEEKRAKNVAFIEHLDDAIGKVLATLRASGLDENTLIVFTSDNGGALRYAQSNGDLRGGKQDMYEGGIKVPAYFQWKGRIQPGTESDRLGLHMDLYTTFCEVAGLGLYHHVDGISLLSTLLGKEQITDDRAVFWMRREGGGYGGQAYYAARYRDFKILQNTPYQPIENFNLAEDYREEQALPSDTNETFQRLRQALREHIRATGQVLWQKKR